MRVQPQAPLAAHQWESSPGWGPPPAAVAAPADSQRILVLDRNAAVPHLVRAAVTDMVPLPEVVTCASAGEVADLVDRQGPFHLLVAGPTAATRSGLARLAALRHELPGMAIVVVVYDWPEASLEEIVRAGAVDLIRLPADHDELVTSLGRALELGRRLEADGRVPGAASGPVAAAVSPVAPTAPGKVFTVCSATGGCGKTFFVTNLAWFLAHHTGKRVCIVDLDLQFGEVSTALRLRPPYTVHDLLDRDDTAEEDLRAHLAEYLVTHETGVHVLAAPKDPAEADHITPPDVTKVLHAVRAQFDYVIVDTPARLSEAVLAAFDQSETLFGMLTLDLPSVRNMSVFLNTLARLKIPADDVSLVLNKEESDVGIDVAAIEKLFPQRFAGVLPYAKEVSRSINLGMPVMASSPHAEVSRRMVASMSALLPEGQRAAVQAATGTLPGRGSDGGWLARLFRRG